MDKKSIEEVDYHTKMQLEMILLIKYQIINNRFDGQKSSWRKKSSINVYFKGS